MDRADLLAGFGGEEPEDVIRRLAFLDLPDGSPAVQIPAKKARGLVSSNANQTGGFLPSGNVSFSLKLVNGTTQRCSIPSQRRQCGDLTFRMLVTPESEFRPLRANSGEGMPQRAIVSSRPSG
jgi:hypothetical protein